MALLKLAVNQQTISEIFSSRYCRNGHYCVVPCSGEKRRMQGFKHIVTVDSNYVATSCHQVDRNGKITACPEHKYHGRSVCSHMQAVEDFYAPQRPALLDEEHNPLCEVARKNGRGVFVRISLRWQQLTEDERVASRARMFEPVYY